MNKQLSLSRVGEVLSVVVSDAFRLPKCCQKCPMIRERVGLSGRYFYCELGSFNSIYLVAFNSLKLNKLRHADCKIDKELRLANASEAQSETALADLLEG